MIVGTQQAYDDAKQSLQRIQDFDIPSLARTEELGRQLNFEDAQDDAQKLVELFARLSVTSLQDLPDQYLNIVKSQSDAVFNIFQNILDFDLGQQDPSNVRKSLIDQVTTAYSGAFQHLHPFISYSLHRSADFQRLDTQARATLQAIEDKSNSIASNLQKHEEEAKGVLDEIRKVAAEEGVTKQAVHFSTEVTHHESEAGKWQTRTICLAGILGTFAVISLFIHKIPVLAPQNTYDAVQLSLSKFLIFSVVAYLLFLSAKNFLNHKHNAIVNKHRQNALMTHTALVEASGDEGVRDAVLLQASSCIFSPQSTGYTATNDGEVSNQRSAVEIMTKPFQQAVKNIDK